MSADYHQPDSNMSLNGASLDAAQLAEARLTAYVLGELDADDRAAVEKALAESESARQQLGAIRRSVELVTGALASEPGVELPIGQRQRLIDRVVGEPREADIVPRFSKESRPARSVRRKFVGYALAASILLCVAAGLGRLLLSSMQTARNVELASLADRVRGTRAVDDANGYRDRYQSAHEEPLPESKDFFVAEGIPMATGMVAGQPEPTADAHSRGLFTVDIQDKESGVAKGMVSSSTSMAGGFVGRTKKGEALFDLSPAPSDRLAGLGFSEGQPNTESYARLDENSFLDVRRDPLSTFSIDVDTASYANVRRFLNGGSLPPRDAVRIEEMLNYFSYHYAPPADQTPFAVHAEVAGCPWEPKHRLLRIALKGREIDLANRPASNLVFLIDVSGSMDDPAKLPLLQSALRLLIDKLAENDRVAMVVYAGSSGLVLPSTSGLYKETILRALDQLHAGGSTNGGSGIQLAYQVAREKFIQGGTNRVLLCTDGDFNVGVTDQGSLTRLIEEEAKSGVFLSVLGFGTGNLKDSTMEQLADRGNGNYAYIDTHNEARKVLVEQLGGTLVTIAKDVKLQLEFNPRQVAGYRLIGYENRLLRAEDFNDDKKDAGEIGAGHTVTALYELVPAGGEAPAGNVDGLKYQRPLEPAGGFGDESLTLKLRYKEPEGASSKLIETVVKDAGSNYAQASEDFRFSAAVAGFGLLLRDSQYKGDLTFGAVLELAQASRGTDENGYRAELIELVKKAQALRP
ncbi:MAG TPA: von Willebrand factor type A domain-containing protein [Pirellulales bacterium]|nr:von Willebrand factor type A domain-containing protein [Pirellulales bacterium]